MVRERVADNVYVFTSEVYAQVNAGVIVGPEWSVVIDTLPVPSETIEMRDYVEKRLNSRIRYVINTHYHADHTFGNSWFKTATIVGDRDCRDLLDTRGREALAVAKQHNREMQDVEIVLPSIVFEEGSLSIKVGKRTLKLLRLPGHSPDGIGVLVLEDRVLFSGDSMLPIPFIVDGDPDILAESMKRIPRLNLESLVQGHGDVILRGEVQNAVRANLNYLTAIEKETRKASRRRDPQGYLATIDVERCGKSRILLNGLAEELHRRNLEALYHRNYEAL
ncbi:MAG: MBL fold metallo-hydrolase [Anaerolineales bacterium]|jgi:glyoxylase-like metal-dependent hydrolase (beta-lactamase superfamily II)